VSEFGIPEPTYLGVGVKDEVVVRVTHERLSGAGRHQRPLEEEGCHVESSVTGLLVLALACARTFSWRARHRGA